nr:hypothetical protein SHINE37_44585 [Rhizobiaceae bacterium]
MLRSRRLAELMQAFRNVKLTEPGRLAKLARFRLGGMHERGTYRPLSLRGGALSHQGAAARGDRLPLQPVPAPDRAFLRGDQRAR